MIDNRRRNRILLLIISACMFVFLTLLVGFFYFLYHKGYTSEPFKLTEDLISQSDVVKNELGVINNLYIYDFSLVEGNTGGEAEFEIYVTGQKKNGYFAIKAEKKQGKWYIVAAIMKLQRELSWTDSAVCLVQTDNTDCWIQQAVIKP